MEEAEQEHEDARKMHRTKLFVKDCLGGHDLVRRLDRQREVLIWCTVASRSRQVGTEELGKMLKRIQLLQAGSLPRRQETVRLKDKKMRITRKECKMLLNEFEMGD